MSKKLLLEAIHSSGLFRNVRSSQIFLLGLNYCTKCAELKMVFEELKVPYKFIDADVNTRFSDQIEEITGHEFYPMVLVYDGKDAEIITEDFEQFLN